jgi:DNA-binding GntR family transcriptional regulator
MQLQAGSSASAISRDVVTPVYEQIAAILRGRIEARAYKPGRRLPSAPALADEFGVAVQTIRAALRQLADEQLVRSVARRGTYVNGGP